VKGGQSEGLYPSLSPNVIWGPGNIDADPLSTDVGSRDYHLQAISPFINAAHEVSLPANTADLDRDGDTAEPVADFRIAFCVVYSGVFDHLKFQAFLTTLK